MLNVPLVGLSPIILFSAAGIRPEPPVSVPKEKHTCFFATDKAEPELEPPDAYSLLNAEAVSYTHLTLPTIYSV